MQWGRRGDVERICRPRGFLPFTGDTMNKYDELVDRVIDILIELTAIALLVGTIYMFCLVLRMAT